MDIQLIKTKDTETETWTYLELFSIRDYTKEKLSAMHSDLTPDELDEKAFWINSCISQAREYYTATSSVSFLTKPLLLYYGMYSLAKALIFLKNPRVDLSTLSHHGLMKPKINDSPEEFLNARVKAHEIGVFRHLSRHAQNNRCVIVGKEEPWAQIISTIHIGLDACFSELNGGRTFSLDELLMSIPELFDLLLLLGKGNLNLLKIEVDLNKNISGNWFRTLTVYKYGNPTITPEFLYGRFPEISKDERCNVENTECFVFSRGFKGDFETLIPKTLVQSSSQELFLASTEKPISDINVHFMVMFLLGHIVRYKPPLWQGILRTRYRSIIDKFIATSERKFPHLILNELLHKTIFFV